MLQIVLSSVYMRYLAMFLFKRKRKRIPQEVYDQIQQALTLPDLNQSQIALFLAYPSLQ